MCAGLRLQRQTKFSSSVLFEHTIETDDQKFTRKNHGAADQYYSTWQDQRYFLYRLVTLVVVTGMQQSRRPPRAACS
jgi:hypothetical protein